MSEHQDDDRPQTDEAQESDGVHGGDPGAPTDPDPADEAAGSGDGPGAGPDGTVPGAGTAGAGGAKRAR